MSPPVNGWPVEHGQRWLDARTPLVVLDAASVETHFLVQPLRWISELRESHGAVWLPLASAPAELDRDREQAEQIATRSRLPLKWPKRDPRPASRAMRIATLASAHGCCAIAIHQLCGLAYAAGLDLEGAALGDDPVDSYLRFIAARTKLPLRELLQAAEEGSTADRELTAVAERLAEIGITTAPALRWNARIYQGHREVSALLSRSRSPQRSSLRSAGPRAGR